jgi:protein involved in sex pheromone biosynthesis
MKKLCIILLVFSLMLSGCSWFRGQEDAVMEKKATVTEQEDTVVGKDAKLYRG